MGVLRVVLRVVMAGLLVAGGLVLATSGPAAACSCAQSRTAKLVEGADVVFTGTVTDVDSRDWLVVPSREVVYRFDVDTVYAGEADDEVASEGDGGACGLEGIEEGERYVVLAYRADDGLRATLCGGTAPASRRMLRQVEAVAGRGSPAPAALDGSPEASLGWAGWLAAGAVLVGGGAGWLRRRRRS